MMVSADGYTPLPRTPSPFDEPNSSPYNSQVSSATNLRLADGRTQRSPWSSRVVRFVVAIESIIVLVLIILLLREADAQPPDTSPRCSESNIYSPAEGAIELKEVVFSPDFYSKEIYARPPSPDVDKAWDGLYKDVQDLQIPRDQAKLLHNKTAAIPADPDNYIIALAVFHQLHCLNNIRKATHLEYYADPVTGDLDDIAKGDIADHVTHCIDSIRQSIMCASDVSPIVVQWDPKKQRSFTHFDVSHTCRDFDKIRDWAGNNRLQHEFDRNVHV